jgi:hypothetical protein
MLEVVGDEIENAVKTVQISVNIGCGLFGSSLRVPESTSELKKSQRAKIHVQ